MTSNYSIPLQSNETYNNQESAFYSHSLNMKTRKLGIFRKSPRPSLLIKRAALGNLKTSFHCTHWHHFFPLKKEFFLPLRLSCKESATVSPSPSQWSLHPLRFPRSRGTETSGSGDVTAHFWRARNRYALRLSDRQRSRHILRDGTAWMRVPYN